MTKSHKDLADFHKDLAKRQDEKWDKLQESMERGRRQTEEAVLKMREKTEKAMLEERRKTEKAIRESERRTERFIRELGGTFDNRWGDFMESLVHGDLLALLDGQGVTGLRKVRRNRKVEDDDKRTKAEFDLMAHNGDKAALVEVKTTLHAKHVDGFLYKLDNAKAWLPDELGGKTVYGVVAFLSADGGVKRRAEKKGLLLIESPGGAGFSRIANTEGFEPRTW